MPFKIAVIGAGSHGARYVRHAANDVAGMLPVALCRRDRDQGQRLAEEFGCRYLAETQAVIADPEVDGIVIATPPSSHFRLARDVLAADKPLLLEKPMTGTLTEARELCRLDTASGSPGLLLAQSLRWNPVIVAVKALWPRLGRVHLVRLAQRLEPTRLAWQRNPDESVGGSVLLTGVHIFDLARHLTGREFAQVDSRQRQVLHPSLEDFFLARAWLDDGCCVSLEVSKYTRSRACWLEAVGEAGQLRADYLHGGITFFQEGRTESIAAEATAPSLPPLLGDWLAAVLGRTAMPVTATDGLRTLEVVTACYLSAQQRRPVRIEEL